MSGRRDAGPIVFDEDGPPRSRLYGDVYFSRAGGLAQAREVFLAGCGLPERFAGRARFVVGELGFGTGLGVLALVDLWRASRAPGAQLSVFSVDAHPLTRAEAARALACAPELAPLARLLLDRWPALGAGFHRVRLRRLGVTLDLAVMQAEAALEAWSGRADAWFLDGFAPARNPAMWSPALMRLVARRSAPGARAATYTVAQDVRGALAEAGFATQRRPGFGPKRHRLEASLAAPGEREAPRPRSTPPLRAVIVGAGIAGASLARALAGLGARPRLIEAERAGAGASGNPAALVTPRLDAGLGAAARLHAQAFEHAIGLYRRLPGAVIARGALQLRSGPRDQARFAAVAASDLFAPGALALASAHDAEARLGEPAPPGLYLRDALVVEPAAILRAWARPLEVARIARIEAGEGAWRLLALDGSVAAEAQAVCLTLGADLRALWREAPVRPVRGQLSWAADVEAPAAAAWGAYLTQMRGGLVFGATYDPGDADRAWRAADDARNLDALSARLPALRRRLDGVAIAGRASVRAATADHLPLAGAIAPGLYVLGALGSRGYALAPLLAEHVAALVLDAPSPLPNDLARLVAPDRFRERAARRNSLAARGKP